jgi:hypothetical protein
MMGDIFSEQLDDDKIIEHQQWKRLKLDREGEAALHSAV